MNDEMRRRREEILAQCHNDDGSLDLLKAITMVTGVDPMELAWVAERTTELMDEGLSLAEIKQRLLEEREGSPWNKE